VCAWHEKAVMWAPPHGEQRKREERKQSKQAEGSPMGRAMRKFEARWIRGTLRQQANGSHWGRAARHATHCIKDIHMSCSMWLSGQPQGVTCGRWHG
jgi:hypothetical protein